MGTVHGPPPVLGGFEQLEGQVFGGVIAERGTGPYPPGWRPRPDLASCMSADQSIG